MGYQITDGVNYVVMKGDNTYALSTNEKEAHVWDTQLKANNFLKTFPKNLKTGSNDFEIIPTFDDVTKIELNFEIDTLVNELTEKMGMLKKRSEFLHCELSRLDKERVDIEHAAEFYTLNASQGYKIYRMLHDNGVERRKVKNEIAKIALLMGQKLDVDSLANVQKGFKGMENRKYSPRVLEELFENE